MVLHPSYNQNFLGITKCAYVRNDTLYLRTTAPATMPALDTIEEDASTYRAIA
jgi:hypothetical protein